MWRGHALPPTAGARRPTVVGVDPDRASIDLARQQDPGREIDLRCADFMEADLPEESFDLVASVATLHHLDPAAALRRMAQVLRPGGRLVVGLARSTFPRDLPRELAAMTVAGFLRARRGHWDHPSPTVWPPPQSYPQLRELAADTLPGVRYRRHLLWRYSLVWVKPGAT